jgi:hypothetical protein
MKIIILLFSFLICEPILARTNVIFSMTQELPMGIEDEVIKKNYYVNMGSSHGVKKNSVLDVFRIISIQNPYDNKKRMNYRVKIGELKVLHVSEDAAITSSKEFKQEEEVPVFEIPQFMIGDHVSINVD